MIWLEKFLTFGYRHRLITVLLVLILTVLAWNGLSRIKIDTDMENLISAQLDREIYDELNAEFMADNVSVVYIKDKNLFTADKLKKLEQVVNALEKLDNVDKVNSIFNSTMVVQDNFKFVTQPIIEKTPATDEEADGIKNDLQAHPLLRKSLVSESGESTAVNVVLSPNVQATEDNLVVYQDVQDVLRDHQYDFEEIFQMGDPRLTRAQYTSMFKDLSTIGPISIALLIGILFIFFMNASSFILPALTSAISILWTFGFMGYVGIPLNLLIVMLPTLIIVMGSTEDTHMLSSYMEEFERDSGSPVTRGIATKYMIKKVSLPVILTAVTTWFGFAVSQFSDVTMIKEFAQAASFSFFANAVVTILVVPAYLSTFGPKPRKREFGMSVFQIPMDFCTNLVRNYPVVVIALFALVVGSMLVFAQRVYVNTAPLSFFENEHPLIQDADELHEELVGINNFFVTFEIPDENGFKKYENLSIVENSIHHMRENQELDSVVGLPDYLSYIHQEANNGDEAFYKLPDDDKTIEQYLDSFKEGDLRSYVNKDYTRANVIIRNNIKNSREINTLIDKIKEDLAVKTEDTTIKFYITGEDLLINESVADLLKSQIISMSYLIGAIFLIISILFTSKLAGVIALIPNIVPLIILFGLMGILEVPLNPGTTLVAVILISIAVDDTLHLFHAYIHECRHEMDNTNAIIAALKTQFRPIVTTSLALAIGFGTLMFSDIKLNASFGMLAAISIMLAMLCDLLLTPVVLSTVRIVGLYNILSMHLIKNVLEKSSLFEDMSPWEVKKAILLCAVTDYKAGTKIIEQNEEDRDMYLILKGHVDIARRDDLGEMVHLGEMTPGEVFGEIAFVDKVRRTATATAQTDVSLIKFNEHQLQKNMRSHPKIAHKLVLNIARILSRKLSETTEKLTS